MGIGKYAQAININQALLKLRANQHFINYSRQIEINYLKQRRVLKVFGPGDLIFGFFFTGFNYIFLLLSNRRNFYESFN